MADEASQRRRFPRYHANLEVIIYRGARAISGHITTISRGGCLVNPPLPPDQEPEIRLSFHLSEDAPSINCKGEIAYTINDRGSGVAFTEISRYNQDLITEYFEKGSATGKADSPSTVPP